MKGLNLRSLTGELHRVSRQHLKQPVRAIPDVDAKLSVWKESIAKVFGDFTFVNDFYKLSLTVCKEFSFDELCKMNYSTIFMMHETVRELFETNPRYEVVRKIMSSMWRWGCRTGTWNEIVDTYNNLRHFSFGVSPDFEIRLDYTKHFNDYGLSRFSQKYLDGVFAYLVYFKKKHVMTIGFSIIGGRGILLQQVQLVHQTGNRFLFQLPPNRLEFVIDLFRTQFPGYRISVIDGEKLVTRILNNYKVSQVNLIERCEGYRIDIEAMHVDRVEYEASLKRNKEWLAEIEESICHLEADKSRLIAFYADTGRFKRSTPFIVSSVQHFRVTF